MVCPQPGRRNSFSTILASPLKRCGELDHWYLTSPRLQKVINKASNKGETFVRNHALLQSALIREPEVTLPEGQDRKVNLRKLREEEVSASIPPLSDLCYCPLPPPPTDQLRLGTYTYYGFLVLIILFHASWPIPPGCFIAHSHPGLHRKILVCLDSYRTPFSRCVNVCIRPE